MEQPLQRVAAGKRPVEIKAPAKLNWVFEVLGRRDDGYHEIRSILQTIDLADELEIDDAPFLSVECDDPGLSGEANLVWLAATKLAESRGITPKARIRIRKRIPVALGLGGGSSDAAATLLALDRLWGLEAGAEDLAEVASQVGSDVAFFLWGGTALVEGRGEVVSPLPPVSPLHLTLVFPDLIIPDKTKMMYSRLTPANYSDGGVTRRMLQIVSGGQFVRESLRSCVYNAFQELAEWEFPVLAEMRREVTVQGGPDLHLCGAGPALFGIPGSDIDHQTVVNVLQPRGAGVYLVTTTS